jgi:uncharacterized protein YpmB
MTAVIIIAIIAVAGFLVYRNNKAKASALAQQALDDANEAKDAAAAEIRKL